MKSKTGQDFRQLRARLLLRTTAMLAAAVFIVYAVYTHLLRGRFASWVIGCLQSLFRMDYAGAFALYERTFRSRMDLILLLSMLLVFAVLFCVYLRWFTGYFEKINAGLDALLQDVPGEISLPTELLSIERRLNAAKLRIDRQKSDMLASE